MISRNSSGFLFWLPSCHYFVGRCFSCRRRLSRLDPFLGCLVCFLGIQLGLLNFVGQPAVFRCFVLPLLLLLLVFALVVVGFHGSGSGFSLASPFFHDVLELLGGLLVLGQLPCQLLVAEFVLLVWFVLLVFFVAGLEDCVCRCRCIDCGIGCVLLRLGLLCRFLRRLEKLLGLLDGFGLLGELVLLALEFDPRSTEGLPELLFLLLVGLGIFGWFD